MKIFFKEIKIGELISVEQMSLNVISKGLGNTVVSLYEYIIIDRNVWVFLLKFRLNASKYYVEQKLEKKMF